jgi:NADPH:quinone reductase-like Zn-dependent oxidoreductase
MESDRYPAGTRVRVSVAGGYVSGTLAEYVSAPDLACVQVPGDLADSQAAAIGVVGISSLISLRDRVASARESQCWCPAPPAPWGWRASR